MRPEPALSIDDAIRQAMAEERDGRMPGQAQSQPQTADEYVQKLMQAREQLTAQMQAGGISPEERHSAHRMLQQIDAALKQIQQPTGASQAQPAPRTMQAHRPSPMAAYK